MTNDHLTAAFVAHIDATARAVDAAARECAAHNLQAGTVFATSLAAANAQAAEAARRFAACRHVFNVLPQAAA